MRTVLKMKSAEFDELITHLLPPRAKKEEAAFLFVSVACTELVTLEVQAVEKLFGHDFVAQESDYLELHDETRARLIKQAHDQNASLIELHSHPGPWPAMFSEADFIGLADTVPHIWWRLRKRPYAAIVVAPSGFDAIVWLEGPNSPRQLDALIVGDRLMKPTNLSLRGTSYEHV
jgi:proteasome lid subunit RPN8/RPN11